MSMPEKIWAEAIDDPKYPTRPDRTWEPEAVGGTEYIRADLVAEKDAEIERLRKALDQMADINALSIVKTFDRGRWVEEIKSQWGGRCTWTTIDQIPEAAAYLRERDTRPHESGVQP